jgi:hypothetical protein
MIKVKSITMAYFLRDSKKSFNLNVMKSSFSKLVSVVLTIGLLLISSDSYSQNTKLSRQEKKEAYKDKQFYNFQVLDTLIQKKYFVLEADFLQNEYGSRIPVLRDINFIKVDSTEAVLQTGTNVNMGYNGVGGTTAEGSIRGLKVVKNLKNLTFYLRFTIVSDIGIYDVSMTINSNRSARATITGLTRGKLVYDGHIENLNNSGFYKGHNSI